MSKRRKRRKRGQERNKSFGNKSVGVSSGGAVEVAVPAQQVPVFSNTLKQVQEFIERPQLPRIPGLMLPVPVQTTPIRIGPPRMPTLPQQQYRMNGASDRGKNTNPLVKGAPKVGDFVGDDPITQEAIRRANQGKKKRSSIDSASSGVGGDVAFQLPDPLWLPKKVIEILIPPVDAPTVPPRPPGVPLPPPGTKNPEPKDRIIKDPPPRKPEPRIPITVPPVPVPIPVPVPVPVPIPGGGKPKTTPVPVPVPVPVRTPVEVEAPEEDPNRLYPFNPGGRSYWRRSNRTFTIGRQDYR